MVDRSITFRTFRLFRTFLGMALLLPLSAHAQFGPTYRVEVVVFSRPSGAGAEHWNATPELAYPAMSRFLMYPGEQPAESILSPATVPAPVTDAPAVTPDPMQPALFTTLPDAERLLAGKAAAMQGSGRYRILFHEAWWQPIYSQADSLPIVLDRSGDGGEWPALQGTIKLYLSLEVFMETNLWLNTQGEYLPGSWRMPPPPLAPSSNASASVLPAEGQTAVAGAQTSVANSASSNREPGAAPNYPYRHAVLLRHTQRLLSGELTYVDHPLLGVLVLITPLIPNVPEIPATTETPAPTPTPAPTE